MKLRLLFENVYLLQTEIGGRSLQLPLLIGAEHSVLIDTGCAPDVAEVILPAFKEIGLKPSALSFIINTHCDLDHTGGNHEMKKAAPQALVCCGDADRDLVESPEKLIKMRYDAYRVRHNHHYSAAAFQWMRQRAGKYVPVDLTFSSGERLRLAKDWELRILHLPGHSCGHVGVWDLKNRTLFGGDALHGSGCLDANGKYALCPTYEHIDSYLASARLIESLPIKTYCGSHWPVKRGREIRAFCQESRDFVKHAEKLLLSALNRPKTLGALCAEIGPMLGNWTLDVSHNLCYAFAGHLDNLKERGLVREMRNSHPIRYALKK